MDNNNEDKAMSEMNLKSAGLANGFFLFGGHAVSSALISHQHDVAILSTLTIALCVLILTGVERLTVAKTAPVRRATNKPRAGKRAKQQPRKLLN
ncbi:MAG TPA: hypothetical protein VER32_09050 [Pyrinomonadaceae bacterium]|nr:hypothetical protein [Pyrinomonadaceae bacterium]